MSKILWKSLLVSPAVLLAALLVSVGAVRADQGKEQLALKSQAKSVVAPPQTDVETLNAKSLKGSESNSATTPKASASLLAATPASNAPVLSSSAALKPSTTLQVAETASKQPVVAPEAAPDLEMSKSLSAKDTPVNKSATLAPNSLAQQPSDSNTLQQLNRYGREGRGGKTDDDSALDQVTNVSQFSDVRPGDWAYEALRELVERYGCIAGYPNGTYRGNRALSRYEFAAGLRACLNQVEKLIAASTADFATKEDLEKLRRLTQEFQAELATLGTRVDKLEGRVGFLETHQFSTTTKLVGEVIVAATAPLRNRNTGGNAAAGADSRNAVFGDRVRLDLQTSFTGQDILHTRLAAGNLSAFNLNSSGRSFDRGNGRFGNGATFEGNQTFNIAPDGGNTVKLDWLAYEFPYQSSKVYIAATGGLHADYAPVLNPYFYDGDGGNGALSTFATESPIYRIGGGAGGGIRFGTGKIGILGPTSITLGYLADNGNISARSNGLVGGDYGALAQVNFNLADRIAIGATYVNGYHTSGNGIYDIGGSGSGQGTGAPVVGSTLANNPAALIGSTGAPTGTGSRLGRMVTNSYGVEAAFRLSDKISISGFGMKTSVRVLGRGDGQIWSYGGGVALPDFGKKGNVLGLFAGVEPTLRSFRFAQPGTRQSFSRDSSYHVEGFYKYQVSDNISLTPGVIWLTAPNQDKRNQNDIIGTLRTTFTF